jgi:hypothetical protein
MPHKDLRALAKQCGLHNNRSGTLLVKDLEMIQQGKPQAIALSSWHQSMLLSPPKYTAGVLL